MTHALQPGEFQSYWVGEYPDSPPIGFLLRDKYRDRWLRIHSLPGSKRYPENDAEAQEILHRHHTVIDALLGPHTDFLLLTTGYSDDPSPALPKLLRTDTSLRGSSSFAFTVASDTGSPYWHFFIARMNWQRGCLDEVLAQVATDKIGDVLVIGLEQNCAYHPYDGGGDVIVRDDEARAELRQMFSTWLSPRADGL